MQNGPSVETVLNYRKDLRDDQKTQLEGINLSIHQIDPIVLPIAVPLAFERTTDSTAMLFSTHEALKLEEIEEIGNTVKVSWTSRAAKATMELKWFSEKHLLPVSMTWIYPTIATLKQEKKDFYVKMVIKTEWQEFLYSSGKSRRETWLPVRIETLDRESERVDTDITTTNYRLYWYLDCPKDLKGKVMGVRWEEQFDRIKMKSREQKGAPGP